MLRRRKNGHPTASPPPPEAAISRAVGTPMSHESVLLLARLQAIADQLERAVLRLEKQSDSNEGDPDA